MDARAEDPSVTVARSAPWRRLLTVPTPLVFGLSVAIAAVLLWRQGSIGDLGETARRLAPAVLAAVLALYAFGLALLCLRWHALVRMAGGTSSIPLAAEAFLTSVVVNYAAPIGLAVPTRAALSARDLGLSAGSGAAVAVWEVGFDVAVLGALSLTWLAVGDRSVVRAVDPGSPPAALLAVVALAALGLAALVAARRPGWRRRARLAARDLLRYPGRRPEQAALALGLTIAYWAFQAAILRLLLGAVGVGSGAGPTLILGLLGPPVLVGMLSPVPGGAGVREALMVAVAQAQGVDGAAVLLAAVAYRAALFVAIPPLYAGARFWRAARSRGAP